MPRRTELAARTMTSLPGRTASFAASGRNPGRNWAKPPAGGSSFPPPTSPECWYPRRGCVLLYEVRGERSMPTLYTRVRNRVLQIALRHRLSVTPRTDLIRLGTIYGGWVIPSSLPKSNWTCYCAGVGEDVSFDLALIERYRCQVFAFDFTPRAIVYAEPIAVANPRFHFFPYGLWSSDTELTFWAPADPAHVSYSAMNLQGTTQSITAPVRSLSSMMRELGHDHIDLLKMDIEGAEFEVIDSLIQDTDVRPSLVCVEFDQPVSARRVHDESQRLVAEGYDLVAIDGWNYTFARQDAQ